MNEPPRRLQELWQSIWYDNLRHALLDSGGLRQYVGAEAGSTAGRNAS